MKKTTKEIKRGGRERKIGELKDEEKEMEEMKRGNSKHKKTGKKKKKRRIGKKER